jgi:surfeit locus 1 family protein
MTFSRTVEGSGARFRPGLVLTLCAVLGFAALTTFGTWQAQRLAWKNALIADAEARLALPPLQRLPAQLDAALDFRPARLVGRLDHDAAFLLGSQVRRGELGGMLVVPFVLADDRAILVERGWLPERLAPPDLPDELRPEGEVEVAGVLRWRERARPNPFTPASRLAERRLYWLDRAAIEAAAGRPIAPVSLVAGGPPTGATLPAAEPLVVDYRNDHLGYAITWFSLAGILLVFYVLLGLRRGRAS